MEVFKSLKGISFDLIFEAFDNAFTDYEIQFKKEEVRAMLHRRGFVPELSFAAFNQDEIISFTLNGIGLFNGVKTAYDTGTGTIKEFRGRGLASKIFTHSIPILKEAGVSSYVLEVLQHNTSAVSVYKKLGFQVSREFNYFSEPKDVFQFRVKELPSDYSIHQIDETYFKFVSDFWDFTPSWQNSLEAIMRKSDDFKKIGVFKEQQLIGYCIFEPISGDISQLAVDKNFRRKGIATNLIQEVLKFTTSNSVKMINTDVKCESITEFMKSGSVAPKGKQFEMMLEF